MTTFQLAVLSSACIGIAFITIWVVGVFIVYWFGGYIENARIDAEIERARKRKVKR